MTDPEETLSAIDAAIDGWTGRDYALGDDAMRWAPESPEPEWRGAEKTEFPDTTYPQAPATPTRCWGEPLDVGSSSGKCDNM